MDKHVVSGEPQYQSISVSSSGDNIAIAAVAGKQIKVIAAVLVATGAVTLQVFSDVSASNVPLSGPMALAANGVLTLSESDCGYWQTAAGKQLTFKLGGAVAVNGSLTYEVF